MLFLSWLLWGCLFNPANARLGLFMVYLMGLSPLLNSITPLVGIRSLASPWALPPSLHLFCRRFIEDVWHLDAFLRLVDVQVVFGILSQCFAHCFIVSPSSKISTLICHFLLHLYGNFGKTFGFKLIEMP
jgi:hypothetical protein